MLVDWFTVVAQIINFLVLVVLLKYLLYDRIVKAMDDRQQKIADRLHEARQKGEEAENEAQSYREKIRQLDQQRAQMLDEAKRQADEHRKQLIQEARKETDELKARWQSTLQQQQKDLVEELKRRSAEGLDRAARRALADLANVELEQQVIDVFLRRLKDLSGDQTQAFAAAIRESDGPLIVYSASDIPSDTQQKIVEALRSRFDQNVQAAFKTSPDLICGIELRAAGRAIGWSARGYLDTLTQSITEALQEHAEPGQGEDKDQVKGQTPAQDAGGKEQPGA